MKAGGVFPRAVDPQLEGDRHREAEELLEVLFLLENREPEVERQRCSPQLGNVEPYAHAHRNAIPLEADVVLDRTTVHENDTRKGISHDGELIFGAGEEQEDATDRVVGGGRGRAV